MFGRYRYRDWKSASRFERYLRRLRLAFRIGVALLLGDLCYVAGMWPNWDQYARGPIFKSSFIQSYERERIDRHGPPLRWRPVPLEEISPSLLDSVLVAEDSRFYRHNGFDKIAFEEAMEYNLERRRMVYGGSTISQQTVKNLFLRPSRNPIRKWHELLLTLGMELHLDKRRILELYLNVAEFGVGIYGVEAAARAYWGIAASDLDLRQAVELAATLPAPREHNPRTRTSFFLRRKRRLLSQLAQI